MRTERFADRADAARRLADRLQQMRLAPPVVVLALPRGGVPIAVGIAAALGAALDVLPVRKIGLAWQPELAVAALVDGDPPELVIDHEVQRASGLSRAEIDAAAQREAAELARRRERYLGGRAPIALAGATAIVVDDGIATGTTMRAALQALRRRHPARLVLAVPVAPADTLARLRGEVDDIVCLATPEPFRAVGLHYADFHQVSDEEVLAALGRPAPG